jgi:uncharacterized cupredoxin-like copper-binding protein
MRTRTTALAAMAFATPALAQTTQPEPHVFRVPGGVEFTINNDGISDFLFNWSDAGGVFVDIPDPTLMLTAGQTYRFRRLTGVHPFVVCDNTLPVTGVDGMYERATTDPAVIEAAILDPIDAFIADPAPTGDFIEWTPVAGDAGQYYFTCHIPFHTGMAGSIVVEAGDACRADLDGDGALTIFDFLAFQNLFDSGDPRADFDGDGGLTIFDFLAFQNEFDAGCP